MGKLDTQGRFIPGMTAREPGQSASPQHTAEGKDNFREIIETIVFVVVLVLLLKTFIAEAFVIPTGSMATTLLGYHRNVTCPECGHPFTVNRSREMDDKGTGGETVTGCTCPNCRFHIQFPDQKRGMGRMP